MRRWVSGASTARPGRAQWLRVPHLLVLDDGRLWVWWLVPPVPRLRVDRSEGVRLVVRHPEGSGWLAEGDLTVVDGRERRPQIVLGRTARLAAVARDRGWVVEEPAEHRPRPARQPSVVAPVLLVLLGVVAVLVILVLVALG